MCWLWCMGWVSHCCRVMLSAALQLNLTWADQADLADALLKNEQVRRTHQAPPCLLSCVADSAGTPIRRLLNTNWLCVYVCVLMLPLCAAGV